MNKIIDEKCTCGGAMRMTRFPCLANDCQSYRVECSKGCGTSVEGLHDWEKTKAAWNKAQGPF